jgi:Uma2 family endonuclease
MIMQAEERHYTVEEYFELEVNSEERHEYRNGKIIPMGSGTLDCSDVISNLLNHNKVLGNLYAALNFALKRLPYEVYVTGQRLWIPRQQIYAYPDVMIVAQPIELAEDRRDTLTNPILIAEVLSKSTRSYDRGEKFLAYRTIPSFQEYLLIDQHTLHVEQYFKTGTRKWIFSEYEESDEEISLSSVPFKITISDLYDEVDFNADK